MDTLVDFINRFPKWGERIAIIQRTDFRSFRTSYLRLYQDILKVASLLKEEKIEKGDKVILWAQNSREWATLFLGSLMRGAVVVPIDIWAKVDFIKRVQAKVGAKVIFRTKFKEDPGLGIKTFFIEDLEALLEARPEASPEKVDIKEDDIFQILYTSGTTGEPKGVPLTHKNILSNFKALLKFLKTERIYFLFSAFGRLKRFFGLKAKGDLVFFSPIPLTHVLGQSFGLFVPLLTGQAVIYIQSLKLSSLLAALAAEKINVIITVPHLLEMLANKIFREVKKRGWESQFRALLNWAEKFPLLLRRLIFFPIHRRMGKGFKVFVVGGAPLDPELERFWEGLGFLILQGYGLTEAVPVVTSNLPTRRKIGSVGKVLAGQEIKIKAEPGAKVGEVLVRAPYLPQGYWRDVEKTKELFERDEKGEIWLKTGDIGYIDEQGFLILRGRKKDVIVTQAGVNVYPEDIEKVLNRQEGVIEACVVGWKIDGETPHAVLLLERPSAGQLRSVVEKSNLELASAQQIQSFSLWPYDDFPRTSLGKIKKGEVLEYLRSQEKRKEKVEVKPKPRTPKARLYQILASLSSEEPGKIKPDWELGLDLKLSSIDRIELVALLEDEFDFEIEEGEITEKTTAGQLEKIIKEKKVFREKRKFRRGALGIFAKILRFLLQHLIVFPVVLTFSRIKVLGKENLEQIKEPVVFAANHQSLYDVPVILASLPLRIRTRCAVATLAELFEAPENRPFLQILRNIKYELVVGFFNIFPLPRTGGARSSLRYSGELIDRGFYIVYFPEGTITRTGKISPFRMGIGFLTENLKVPVVPVKLEGLYRPPGPLRYLFKFYRVRVKFGKILPPSLFYGKSYIEITKLIEASIRSL